MRVQVYFLHAGLTYLSRGTTGLKASSKVRQFREGRKQNSTIKQKVLIEQDSVACFITVVGWKFKAGLRFVQTIVECVATEGYTQIQQGRETLLSTKINRDEEKGNTKKQRKMSKIVRTY